MINKVLMVSAYTSPQLKLLGYSIPVEVSYTSKNENNGNLFTISDVYTAENGIAYMKYLNKSDAYVCINVNIDYSTESGETISSHYIIPSYKHDEAQYEILNLKRILRKHNRIERATVSITVVWPS